MSAAQQQPLKIGPKDGVVTCMGVEYFDNDNLLNGFDLGTKMMRISCPSCVLKRVSKPKAWEMPVRAGYTNPYSHFKTCTGDDELIQKQYMFAKQQIEAAKQRDDEDDDDDDDDDSKPPAVPKLQRTLGAGFLATPDVKSLDMWIRLIVLKNMPIGDVQCPIMRESVKFPQVKSSKTVMDTAHRLVRILEDKISKMMAKSPKGQLLFDGYTVAGQHYVGLFASFMEPYKGKKNGATVDMYRHQLRLLAVAPLPAISEDGDEDENEESETFNAKAHINFFKVTLELYGVDFSDWVVCHCADSASVNKKIANDSHGRHLSCGNHNLALGGAKMIEDDESLKRILLVVNGVSAHVRGSCVVSTALRNTAALINPHHANVTAKGESETRRWLGSANTLRQHKKIAPYLRKLSDRNVAKMRLHKESVDPDFLDEVDEHLQYMGDIRATSDKLQTPGMKVMETQGRLDFLREMVEEQKGIPGEKFEKCGLNLRYLKPDNDLTTNAAFLTGVMKIQAGVRFEQRMTNEEKIACMILLKEGAEEVSMAMDEDSDGECIERAYKKAKSKEYDRVMGESKYINCDFIMGSAAIVETLWSEEDALMTKRRQGMTPLTNECILFLKKNRDLWNIGDVNAANQARLKEKKDERLAKKLENEKEVEDMIATVTAAD